ncbi:pyridoxal phosphate-dependent aminotransferase [Megalodesulfovibrio gigas]|uniref:Histidinol-phosphate aminotransferase n=1 Tax=Megalodesulfovibrio gigas (strain ATCC 19364 / DSM 1382 / NCIMB 9332 / VKM B-1759) TaxID=1121448 RepID=T2GDL4_MEGG1|nr:histidinol-phosphate transaminase [Megalodesulfovibrio gigas]AGW14206.1 putative aminotransferase [Megalodesulfovibrio gigas DSM 1382 = ATCC 19364]
MNSLHDRIPDYVRTFERYVPSRPDAVLMRQFGVSHLFRLNNNENALGPPPMAREAIAAFAPERAAIYPSGDAYNLRQALATRFRKSPEQFLVGNGSCEVISSVIRAFCGPGDAIVTADKTFAVYEWVAKFSGIDAHLVPLRGNALDPAAMLAAVTPRTRLVFLCNPNNPTGSWWNKATLTRFLDTLASLEARPLVVLDEAYCEYLDAADCPDYPDGMEYLERYDNLLVFRTFSKMYGLAGFRVGYLCGALEAVEYVHRTHIAYSVNSLGQVAAAAALLDDAAHLRATRRMVAEARAYLQGVFDGLGLEHFGSAGNYIMVRTPLSDTLLYRRLMQQGVMVRTMTGFRFPNWIRISLAGEQAMEAAAAALHTVLDGIARKG